MRQSLRCDANARIGHPNDNPAGLGGESNRDGATFWGVVAGIAKQIGDRLAHQVWLDPEAKSCLWLGRNDGEVFGRGLGCHGVNRLLEPAKGARSSWLASAANRCNR